MNWFPLKNFTHYSLLKGFSKPHELAKICADNDYPACGITDYKSISGAVSFHQACKKVGIKPIIGCSFDNTTVYAKNKDGWHDLIQMVSMTDEEGNMPTNIAKDIISRNNLLAVHKSKDNIKPSYYAKKEQAGLHRVLLCSALKTTLPKIQTKIRKNELEPEILEYFTNDNKCITKGKATKELQHMYESCEDYEILNPPMLPKFVCPKGLSQEEYLTDMAREGYRNFLKDKVGDDEGLQQIYGDRFRKELQVIKDADLFGYFLIVQDIIKHVEKDMGCLAGPGRGSAAGCLISYLIGITKIDPVEHDLIFERFYNAGRNTGGHVSLPDIDMDVPGKRRDDVIDYLKNTYGHDHVSQMITFGRLQGRSAIKEVLRINEACSFSEMNAITKSVPNEADISDQLADMDDEDRSIIRWSLINRADELRDFCHITDDGKLEGDYAGYFQQAIDIEGTFKTQGKHAAGVVISKDKLKNVCPMVTQKGSTEKIAGLEMSDLEALGHVKFDVLGINLLDKLMKIKELTNGKVTIPSRSPPKSIQKEPKLNLNNPIIQIEVTQDMINNAEEKAKEMGKLNNSITKGEGNIAGFIGEEIVSNILGGEIENTYDYDVVRSGKKYDVKTKRCTSPPHPHYECSVAAFNTKQKCDTYVFVRVQYKDNKFGPAWVLGQKDKNDYFREAKKLKKGQVDPSNNFTVKADCYNLSISELKPLEAKHGE